MVWAWIVAGVIGLSLITLSLGASIAVLRSETLGRLQKMARLAAVWAVPLLGAMVVLHRIQETEPAAVPREIVAASGLGWGLVAGSASDARRSKRDRGGGRGKRDSGDGP